MRNKERASNLETFHRSLLTFGNKYRHSSHPPFLQFQVRRVKSGGTGNDTSHFMGALTHPVRR